MNAKDTIKMVFADSLEVMQQFAGDEAAMSSVAEAADLIVDCYKSGGKVLVFGNGGSAADSQHMAAELVVRFEKERKGLPCIALSTDTSIITAGSNDYGYKQVFSRQIEALGGEGDVAVAISTSGNSENVIEGVKAAKAKKMPVVLLSGRDGGKLSEMADTAIVVKTDNTARIQEVHETIIHALCKIVEESAAL